MPSFFFDGVDDVLSGTDSASLKSPTTAITMAAWVRPSSTAEDYCGLFCKPYTASNPFYSYALAQNETTKGDFRFGISDGIGGNLKWSATTGALTIGQWYFVAGTWTIGNAMRVRCWDASGTLIVDTTGANTQATAIAYTTDDARVASSESTNNWGGNLASIGVHNAVLSDGQLDTWRTTGTPDVTLSAFFLALSTSTPVDTMQGNSFSAAGTGATLDTLNTPPIIAQQTFSILADTDDADVWVYGTGYPTPGAGTFRYTGSANSRAPADRSRWGSDSSGSNGLFRFDTSSLPDGATITSATLRQYIDAKNNADNLSYVIEYYTWASDGSAYSGTPSGSAHAGTAISAIISSEDNDFALQNLDQINKSGITSFRTHISQLASNASPTGINTVEPIGYEHLSLPASRLIVEYTENAETLGPTAVSGLTNLTGAFTDIDQDPDGAITDPGLVGSDPQTPGSNGPHDPNTQALWAGSTAHTWTTPANVFDTSDTTIASYTVAANTTDYMDMWFFPAADFSALPSNATVTGVTIASRWRNNGTANRLTAWVQLATANGTLLGNEQAVNAGASPSTTLTTYTNQHSGTMPTYAQLTSGTFGVRTRIRRSNAVIAELARITLTVAYTVPQTVNTQADVALADPVGTLATGATSGQIRARFRKKGTGVSPQGRIEIRQAGATVATPIPNTTITESDADGQLLTGYFDQDLIDGAPTDVTARFVGTGASGGLAELVAIEWVAQLAPAVQTAGASSSVSYNVSGYATKSAQQIRYDILGRVTQSRVASYSVSNRATKSALALFSVIGQASVARQALYHVSGRSQATRVLGYNVSGYSQTSRTALYNVSGFSTQSRLLSYGVLGLTTQSRTLAFALSSLSTKSGALLYEVLFSTPLAGQISSVRFDVRSLATLQAGLIFDIYTRATKLRTQTFDVYGLSTPPPRALSYAVYGRSGKSGDLRYDVATRAGLSPVLAYDISARAGILGALSYSQRSLSGIPRLISFDVSSLALVVSQARTLMFDIRTLAQGLRSVEYSLSTRVAQLRQASFDVSGLSKATREMIYALRSLSGGARTAMYDVGAHAALVSKMAQVGYDVSSLAQATPRTVAFHICSLAGRPGTLVLFNVGGYVSTARDLRYDVSSLILKSRPLAFDIRTLSKAEATLLYDLGGYVLTSRTLSYRVERIGDELVLILEGEVLPASALYNDVELATLIEEKIALTKDLEHELLSTSELEKRLLIPTRLEEDIAPA